MRRGNRAGRGSGWAWSYYILPYMEQNNIYSKIEHDWSVRISDQPNRTLVASLFPSQVCPSATNQPTHFKIGNGTDSGFMMADPGIAATNYVACAGAFVAGAYYDRPERRKNGIMGEDTATKFGDITDGTSNTILAGEAIYYGIGQSRGSGSFFWDPSWYGRCRHNAGGRADAPEALFRIGQSRINPPAFASNGVKRNAFASHHPGGASFALADGSTHYFKDTISNNETNYNQYNNGVKILGAFQRLTAMNDGLVVAEQF